MTSFNVNIKPEIIKWARESVRLSIPIAAKKLGVSENRLLEWESGEKSPTYTQLKNMARVYKRPVAVFYLQSPPKDFDALKEFRRKLDDAGIQIPYELAVSLDRVRAQQDVVLELHELDERPIPQTDKIIDTNIEAEEAGTTLRKWLGLNSSNQRRWSRSEELTARLSELIERKGILVTQIQRVPVSVMRGCALSDHPIPAIVVNGADSHSAKAFTLLHELVHILLRISDGDRILPVTRDSWRRDDQVERYCNTVAAAALVPASDLLELVVSRSRVSSSTPWTVDQLLQVARNFGCSPEVVMLRLISLHKANWDNYQSLRDEFTRLPVKVESSTDQKSPLYYPLKARDLGKLYIGEVISAYRRSDITMSEVSDYLDIKINNLPRLLQQIGSESV